RTGPVRGRGRGVWGRRHGGHHGGGVRPVRPTGAAAVHPMTRPTPPTDLDGVRNRTRHLISDEARALLDVWAPRGRDTHRSMLLAYVSGYLGAYCEQIDRDPSVDPREIAAVVRGVLDVVTARPHAPKEEKP